MKHLLLLLLLALPALSQAPAPATIELPMIPELSREIPPLPATVPFGIDPTAPAMSTTWTTADGFSHNVTTPKKVQEGAKNQAHRHAIAVKALADEVGYPVQVPNGA